MEELHELSAAEIGRKVNAGELRPTEVVQYFLDRIRLLNPNLNAFVYVKEQEALEAAKELEKRLGAGDDVGPFAGVPFALKDFLPSKKGWTNTHGGVRDFQEIDRFSSIFCKAMEKAGGIAIGKTNAPAFGFRGTTDNETYGPTKNPYSREHNSGGSSGGSAAAVGAGLVPIAEGGDAGGSIRIPAAWCNCYGFKASAGVIPNICRPDGWAATHPFCTPGAITKTVEDAAILLGLMSKYDPRDPYSHMGVGNLNYANTLHDINVRDLRVAVTLDFGIFKDVDPEVSGKVLDTALILQKAGARITFVPPVVKDYDSDYIAEEWCKALAFDTVMQYREQGCLSDLKKHCYDIYKYQDYITKGSLWTVYNFNRMRTHLLDDFESVFKDYDIILSPVTICKPVRNAEGMGATVGPYNHHRLIGFAETYLSNLTGHPAASCPAGFSVDGLPIGVQITGRKYDDVQVLRVSQFLESVQKQLKK